MEFKPTRKSINGDKYVYVQTYIGKDSDVKTKRLLDLMMPRLKEVTEQMEREL
jgi:hypothetical protein